MGVALVFQPGASLGHDAQAMLGEQLKQAAGPEQVAGLLGFLQGLVPSNVFDALSQGKFISIVFFCALVGLALGVVRAPGPSGWEIRCRSRVPGGAQNSAPKTVWWVTALGGAGTH
jgi:Na+/H+-dicarboxylate symporter